jgi:hypothetical protein
MLWGVIHERWGELIYTVRPELVEGSLSWFDRLTTNGVYQLL